MSLIAPFSCPICGALARREHLRDGFELCPRCGFAIQLDEHGELIGFATTNLSHSPLQLRAWNTHESVRRRMTMKRMLIVAMMLAMLGALPQPAAAERASVLMANGAKTCVVETAQATVAAAKQTVRGLKQAWKALVWTARHA